MGFNILMISDREEDRKFGDYFANTADFTYHETVDASEVKTFLIDQTKTIVFWDGDARARVEPIAQILQKANVPPLRVFLITDKPLNEYPYIFRYPAFGHHIYRRFEAPAPELYKRLGPTSLIPHPFGIDRYFPPDTKTQKIVLKRSTHKAAAVQAMQNYLQKLDLNSRVSALVAQAVDELLLNAIFDAPVDAKGQRTHKALDRASDFELKPKEQVTIEAASTDQYVGISVTDQFGSLSKDVLLGFLRKDYTQEAFSARKGGLGLHGTIQAGLSILFISKPKVKTEVMLFFPRAHNMRDFREGFRFLSIMAE